MSEYIRRHKDIDPDQGRREYGDVEFADPTNSRYPIYTAEHVRTAWSYINHEDNAAEYSRDEVETIRSRIRGAAGRHGVEIRAE
jgi:hypothetical protein